jgi:hypothetical protein
VCVTGILLRLATELHISESHPDSLRTRAPATHATHLTTNGLRLELQGLSGASYTVQASTNLIQWLPLVTNTCPLGFTDTDSVGFRHRFYRGLWQP